MDRRRILLQSLIALDRPPAALVRELSQYEWDTEHPIVILSAPDAQRVIRKFLNGEIQAQEVEDWANALEGRDDVGFEQAREQVLRELIHEFANPTLTEGLTRERATDWTNRLSILP